MTRLHIIGILKITLVWWNLLFVCHAAVGQDECDLKKSQDNIFVYTCKSPDSKLKSIKATFRIDTRLSVLAALLMDAKNYTQWQYNMIDASVLQKISENDIIYHSEVEAPWPVSNRDLVMHLKITQDPKTKVMIIHIESIPTFIPEKEGVVRVPKAEGQWVVIPVNKNELQVDYSFIIDPGGTVPTWLINMALAEGPFETFRNLKKRIQNEKVNIPATFITD